MKPSTKAIHAGLRAADPSYGSVVPPIYPSSTFVFPNAKEGALRFAGKSRGMIYSRFTNPTVEALEKRLAALEDGEASIATGSGMSAITMLFLHVLRSGDTLLAHRVLYGGTIELVSRILPKFGIKTKLIDFTDPAEIEKSIDKSVKLLYFETPTNPMLEIVDIAAIAKVAKKHQVMSAIDNTFAPPPLQYPLKMAIDVVVHSLTKYLGGHSDVVGGAVIGKENFIREMFSKTYPFLGPTMSPFSAYLVMRGITTLDVRLKKICESSQKIALFLREHQKIERVYYPGLSDHQGHKIAKSQMAGFGGVISFEVKGGYSPAAKLADGIKLFSLAVSLGGVESLIEHPASMTHSELSEDEMRASGIRPGLIRISVGLEDVDDLISALQKGLDEI